MLNLSQGELLPTYVYRCQECGAVLERRQSFQDRPLTQCEVCSGELRRVVQPAGIIFRGSGFYTTDYRSGHSGADGGSGSGDGKADASSKEEAAIPKSSESAVPKPSADTVPPNGGSQTDTG